jgi:transcriptional regulator with XRE-family HTH domain
MGLRLGASSEQQAFEARTDEELSRLVTQLTNEINWHLHEHSLTRADLAGRMGVSPGRVSQILSGGENLTLRTLAALATALDAQFELELQSGKPSDSYRSAE